MFGKCQCPMPGTGGTQQHLWDVGQNIQDAFLFGLIHNQGFIQPPSTACPVQILCQDRISLQNHLPMVFSNDAA